MREEEKQVLCEVQQLTSAIFLEDHIYVASHSDDRGGQQCKGCDSLRLLEGCPHCIASSSQEIGFEKAIQAEAEPWRPLEPKSIEHTQEGDEERKTGRDDSPTRVRNGRYDIRALHGGPPGRPWARGKYSARLADSPASGLKRCGESRSRRAGAGSFPADAPHGLRHGLHSRATSRLDR